ncbi:MAG: hypothetical protein SFW09_09710 [Hyphomicrobiaceae bacterium]|nr:hypothetical protein [Hyphomicrobiaceae bacterium]
MRNVVAGLLALMLMIVMARMPATAGSDTVAYTPGVIKAAVAKGETVLIHYKSTW